MRGILDEKYPKYPTDDGKVEISRNGRTSGSAMNGQGMRSLGVVGVLLVALL